MTRSAQTYTDTDAREAFAAAAQQGDTYRAIRAARELLHDRGGVSQMSFLARAIEKTVNWCVPLKPLKVALLSSFSIEFAQPALITYGFLNCLGIKIYRGHFGQFRQEIIDPTSGLYTFAPDVVILAVEGSDWIPELYSQFLEHWETGFEASIARICEEVRGLLQKLRTCSTAVVLIHNFAAPVLRQAGILDGRKQPGQAQWVHRLNEALSAVSRETESVYIVDYASMVARIGAEQWYDERLRLYARAPIAADQLPHLAVEYMKYFRALTGSAKKCVVVDLDNTLWGGILGEDGLHGIQLGTEYPGSAFAEFQLELLNLHRRGVLLGIASKNNYAEVEEVFAQNKSMILQREDFASVQIHWKPKTESLIAIAQQLNIGLEHIVFVDDNPVECEEVSRALPMLTVICLPRQPERYSRALLQDGLFDSLTVSTEDLRRGELYRQRDQAEALRANSSRPDWLLATVSVRDRFGDSGTVGLMMAQVNGQSLSIDSLLLSCRVIGRSVETAMLVYLCEQARQRGLSELSGRIIPTARNAPVRQLFEQHGFKKCSEAESDETFWRLTLDGGGLARPDWMKIHVVDPARSKF